MIEIRFTAYFRESAPVVPLPPRARRAPLTVQLAAIRPADVVIADALSTDPSESNKALARRLGVGYTRVRTIRDRLPQLPRGKRARAA